jgi:hypothetical protein
VTGKNIFKSACPDALRPLSGLDYEEAEMIRLQVAIKYVLYIDAPWFSKSSLSF